MATKYIYVRFEVLDSVTESELHERLCTGIHEANRDAILELSDVVTDIGICARSEAEGATTLIVDGEEAK